MRPSSKNREAVKANRPAGDSSLLHENGPASPTLAEVLSAARKRMGFSISETARRSGVTQPFLSEMERGRRNPSEAVLERLAETLELDPEDLRNLNTTAALRDFREILYREPELSHAFVGMVRALLRGTVTPKQARERLLLITERV